jgi:ATP-dependent protease ClpP protease subunit
MINSLSEEHTLHFSINSPGGELNYIYALLSAIKRTKALVIMCNTGFAASCGSLLLSSGDQIYIAPQAITMFHGPTSFNYGKSIYSKTSNDILLDTVKVHLKDIVAKGILLEEEYEGIFTRDDEYFIPSDVMITRLKNNNLWYEKGGVL